MNAWRDAQATVARAIRDTGHFPDIMFAGDPLRVTRGFEVYRNNHRTSLIESLLDSFPVTAAIVGDEFFAAMVAEFISEHPPVSPVLIEYGHELPGFIAAFPPAASLPYLADVARLESAWLHAYHAPENCPLTIHHLRAISPALLARARLQLHPSLALVRSPYPVASIWSAHRDAGSLETLSWASEDALIVRPDAEVTVRVIEPSHALFLGALLSGSTIEHAASCAESCTGFDAGTALLGFVSCGAICAIQS